jgi:hypothetical protein
MKRTIPNDIYNRLKYSALSILQIENPTALMWMYAFQLDNLLKFKIPIEKQTANMWLAGLKLDKLDFNSTTPISCMSRKVCLFAVRKQWNALKYIPEELQTDAICYAAVNSFGASLKYVKKQTPSLCKRAIETYTLAIEYVKEPTLELCEYAFRLDMHCFGSLPIQTPEMCKKIVEHDPLSLIYVKEQTEELCIEAVKKDKHAINAVHDPVLRDMLTVWLLDEN